MLPSRQLRSIFPLNIHTYQTTQHLSNTMLIFCLNLKSSSHIFTHWYQLFLKVFFTKSIPKAILYTAPLTVVSAISKLWGKATKNRSYDMNFNDAKNVFSGLIFDLFWNWILLTNNYHFLQGGQEHPNSYWVMWNHWSNFLPLNLDSWSRLSDINYAYLHLQWSSMKA